MFVGNDNISFWWGSIMKKNVFCLFCCKSYCDVGFLVEGLGDVYICGECIEFC